MISCSAGLPSRLISQRVNRRTPPELVPPPELAAAGTDAPGDVLGRLAPGDSDAALAPAAGRQPIRSIIRG